MDEQDYQTIIRILDQRASRRIWFTLHVAVFAFVYVFFNHLLIRLSPFQDQILLTNIWIGVLAVHFLYMCFRDIQGRLLRRRLERGSAENQVLQYPQKRKNVPRAYADESADDYAASERMEPRRETRQR